MTGRAICQPLSPGRPACEPVSPRDRVRRGLANLCGLFSLFFPTTGFLERRKQKQKQKICQVCPHPTADAQAFQGTVSFGNEKGWSIDVRNELEREGQGHSLTRASSGPRPPPGSCQPRGQVAGGSCKVQPSISILRGCCRGSPLRSAFPLPRVGSRTVSRHRACRSRLGRVLGGRGDVAGGRKSYLPREMLLASP